MPAGSEVAVACDVRARQAHDEKWHAEAVSPAKARWRHEKPFDDGVDAWIYVWKIRAHVRDNPDWEPSEDHWTKILDPNDNSTMPGFEA